MDENQAFKTTLQTSSVVLTVTGTEIDESLLESIRFALNIQGIDWQIEKNTKADFRDQARAATLDKNNYIPIDLSIVTPIYDEEKNIQQLYQRLTETLIKLNISYEIIFVDDGSKDASPFLMEQLYSQDPLHVQCVYLSRNFGHQPAISAGLKQSRGKAVIVMDADLQDPPEMIPQFLEKWKQGFQVVYAVREKRKESIFKRAAYYSFYRILKSISRIEIPLDTGDFCLMDRSVVDVICRLPESNRFVRGLRSWAGYKQTGLVYERDARFAGETKYTFRKLLNLAMDGLISFSYLPLRLATILGFVVSALSILLGLYYFTRALFFGLGLPGFATIVVLVSFIGGFQLITIGISGEYIGHILDEVKHRPSFVIEKVLGGDHR